MGTVLTPRNDVCKGAEGMQYIGVDVRRSSKRHRSEAELMMYKKRGSRAPGNVVEIKEAPIDMNKACHEKKERSQPFLLCATINGRSESIRLVIDKQPWLQFREVPCAIISLVGAFFVFDLAYPSECSGALFFLQEFITGIPVRKSLHHGTIKNACLGILATKEMNRVAD
ncbi:uncharacterized protein LOC144648958 [Oculina patagonica]